MSSPHIRRALAFVLLGTIAASCESDPPPPRSEASEPGRCRYFVLDTGDRICLLDKVQSASMRLGGPESVTTAPLIDPNFTGPLPEQVDLRTSILDGCLQVRNQGECGWCVGHAAGTALDALYCAEGCSSPRVSIPHLWATGHQGQIADCGTGWQIAPGVEAASTVPLVHESEWPFAGGSRAMNNTRPDAARLQAASRYRATGYTLVPTGDRRLDIMKRVLASGRVLVVSSGVCANYGWSGGTAPIDTPPTPCGANGETYDGYHAYTIVGYNDRTGDFIGLNSWSDRWGIGGYMRLTRDFVETQLMEVAYLDDVDPATANCMPNPPDDRCASITDCAECATTTGCLYCDGRCTPSNELGDAPASGACNLAQASVSHECPLDDDPCGHHLECGSCTVDSGCSWCGNQAWGRCVSWPEHWSVCTGLRVAAESSMCNDVTFACEAATDCAECLALEGCGFCAGAFGSIHTDTAGRLCFGGNSEHADRASCEEGWTTAICPAVMSGVDASADAGMDAGHESADARVCATSGGPCRRDTNCCMGLVCVAEACRDPSVCGIGSSPCTGATQCCGGLSCLPETLGGPSVCCVGYSGGGCESDDDCCGEITCVAGSCTKRELGQRCAHDNDCAIPLRCSSGTCQM